MNGSRSARARKSKDDKPFFMDARPSFERFMQDRYYSSHIEIGVSSDWSMAALPPEADIRQREGHVR